MKRVVGFARDADHAPDFVPSPAKSGGRIRSFGGGELFLVRRTEPIRATIAILLMGLGFNVTLMPLMSSAMVQAI